MGGSAQVREAQFWRGDVQHFPLAWMATCVAMTTRHPRPSKIRHDAFVFPVAVAGGVGAGAAADFGRLGFFAWV